MSGLEVFTEGGKHVGVLEDVSIDPETGKVLGIILSKLDSDFSKKIGAEGKKGVIVPYKAIKSIGDIVLLRDLIYEPPKKS
jgi:sporulation protein YlmC with PRC-barrel domain